MVQKNSYKTKGTKAGRGKAKCTAVRRVHSNDTRYIETLHGTFNNMIKVHILSCLYLLILSKTSFIDFRHICRKTIDIR